MLLINLIVIAAILNLALWLVQTYVSLQPFKMILTVVLVLIIVIWLLTTTGVASYVIPVGRHS